MVLLYLLNKTIGFICVEFCQQNLLFIYQYSHLQSELITKDPDLLRLGLLYEVGEDAVSLLEPEVLLSFQHKSLQEFSASDHLSKRLDKVIEEGQNAKVKRKLFLELNEKALGMLIAYHVLI